jgi:hypothetical protein
MGGESQNDPSLSKMRSRALYYFASHCLIIIQFLRSRVSRVSNLRNSLSAIPPPAKPIQHFQYYDHGLRPFKTSPFTSRLILPPILSGTSLRHQRIFAFRNRFGRCVLTQSFYLTHKRSNPTPTTTAGMPRALHWARSCLCPLD